MQIDKKEIKEKIGSLLVAARKHAKMTQQEFADKLDVSRSTVANWETGARSFEFEDIPVIADALGVEPIYFLGYIDSHHAKMSSLESFTEDLQNKLMARKQNEKAVICSTINALTNNEFNYEQLKFIHDFVEGLLNFSAKENGHES